MIAVRLLSRNEVESELNKTGCTKYALFEMLADVERTRPKAQ